MTIQTGVDFPLERAQPDTKVEQSSARSGAKRALDIFGAFFGLIFLAPFLLAIALIIKLGSRGPVLFYQRRTGLGGKVFSIYKFRTMRVLEDGDEVTHARKYDDRTTAFGAFLRRSSIDELPQLVNVLKGEMSLVGPRPHAVAHDRYYGECVSGYNLRFMAKPGITGLAQVSGYRGEITSVQNMSDRIALDIAYIGRWTFWLDVKILFWTIVSAPFDRAAY
jgi:putative colanic acid biosynthesis UDP-glucose lipid carrier transferase